jgi:transposase
MANKTKIVSIRAADRTELERVRSQTISARAARRARIVLLASEGRPAAEIAELVGVSEPTVTLWRTRYAQRGLAGLDDQPRSGRPPKVAGDTRHEVLWYTLLKPPADLGVTHWSSRLLAKRVGLHHSQVARIWAQWGIKPWREETFKFSTDPELEAKVRDVIGLYLNPPEGAVVLCVDEKSQLQALERTQPMLPVRPGLAARRTHDYKRHGTTTLFAALEVATGKVTDICQPRHRHQEFLTFLKLVAKTYPRVTLHIVCDNYATHKHPGVQRWLARNPRIHLHFTPTSGSWLNLVEVFFSIISRQAIRRGSFASVPELVDTIRTFIAAWNERCEPFVWTKTADEVLAHGRPGRCGGDAQLRSRRRH